LIGSASGSGNKNYATGDVSGNEVVGGLYGMAGNALITNNYATGNVNGRNYVGGLIGMNNSTIKNSFALGDVTGTDEIGGLIGENLSAVNNSYSSGKVTGTSNTGGFIGLVNGTPTMSDIFYNSTTTGQTDNVGKGTPFQFLVAAGRDDYLGPMELGELQREQGHAAGSLHDYRISGLDLAFLRDGMPSGDAGARQSGRFFVGQMIGYANESFFRQYDVFCEHPVERTPQRRYPVRLRGFSRRPALGENPANAFSDSELGRSFPEGDDFADSIGDRNEGGRPVRFVEPGDNARIAGIQGDGFHPNQRLTGTGRGPGQLDLRQVFKSEAAMKYVCFHCSSLLFVNIDTL
jgi:hypothetical protein